MYYSNGNYEAFARPKKPEGVDSKNAYIIGTGLAALSAACYLVRDAQMPGDHIHVFEKDAVPGGACDGANIPSVRRARSSACSCSYGSISTAGITAGSVSSAGQFRTFRAARANGSVKVNVLPCPGLLHTDAEP